MLELTSLFSLELVQQFNQDSSIPTLHLQLLPSSLRQASMDSLSLWTKDLMDNLDSKEEQQGLMDILDFKEERQDLMENSKGSKEGHQDLMDNLEDSKDRFTAKSYLFES